MSVALFLPPLCIAALFLFLPFLPPERFFTLAVAPEWRRSPQARHIQRLYWFAVAAIALGGAGLCGWSAVHPWLLYLTPLAEAAALLAAWAWGWRQTLPARTVQPVLRSASLAPASSRWSLSAACLATSLLPLLASGLYLRAHYDAIPLRFAIHFNMHGQADHLAARTPWSVYSPLLLGGAVVLFLAVLFASVSYRSAGVADAGQYAALTRTVLAGVAWFVSISFALTALLACLPNPRAVALLLARGASGFVLLLLLLSMGYMYMRRSSLAAAQSAPPTNTGKRVFSTSTVTTPRCLSPSASGLATRSTWPIQRPGC